jgi:predicted phage terminase large subunit-like protein
MDGGGMLAAGIGGGITGRGADLFLIDDCLKNSDQALSETIRDSQWEWWQTTAYTRLQPGGRMIILSTRWHADDLLGRVLKFVTSETSLRVREVRFQAIAEFSEEVTGDTLGRKEGEALWPEQWPIEHLLRIKSAMSDYWWQALYQQRLTNHGSNEWPESYFWGIMMEPEEWPVDLVLSATALDHSKGKDAKKGDYSAIVNVGYKSGMIYVEADIDRRPVPQMIDDLVKINMRLRPTVTGIEAVAFQELLAPQYVQAQMDCGFYDEPELIQNTINKRIRIARLGYWLRRHKIKIKNNAGGQLLLKQLKDFPSGSHDDGPDALEMAMRLLLQICDQLQEIAKEQNVTNPQTVIQLA